MNRSSTCVSHRSNQSRRAGYWKQDLTIKMHDGFLAPRRLMRVEMRYSKKLPLFSRIIRGSEDQAVQILRRVDQAIESALVLRLRERCTVKVNVCSKEC
jgi:hypothetical protein